MEQKEAFLKEFIQAGGTLVANVPALGGARTVVMTAAQAARLPTEKETVFGELLGLSRVDYVEWFHSQGSVYCSDSTKGSSRCRNVIVGATSLEPLAWLKQRAEGGYCRTHGG
ncbi:hypothetical protein [Herbaspirillum sp.]|uniref:hypothetical protein n=1 Tax=Herbaspirillum sp. TaxID=1890675 RepID=UPI000C095642|nr:hypothetical protein [Herbaspirillum sp.]MAF02090.1 hypothetical protein [Herbaspirillum sp.]|tara:strand:+ start:13350 stop:13688 length:339 start_codon:yes stop_codon:yes gene_type:complete